MTFKSGVYILLFTSLVLTPTVKQADAQDFDLQAAPQLPTELPFHETTELLDSLKDVQKNDPLKTGTEEDYFVNSMMVALLLMETRDRHNKTPNQ